MGSNLMDGGEAKFEFWKSCKLVSNTWILENYVSGKCLIYGKLKAKWTSNFIISMSKPKGAGASAGGPKARKCELPELA